MKIPKTIRLNLTNIIVLSPSPKDIKSIAEENVNSVISDKDLANLIRISTMKPYNFFHINKQVIFENVYEIYE